MPPLARGRRRLSCKAGRLRCQAFQRTPAFLERGLLTITGYLSYKFIGTTSGFVWKITNICGVRMILKDIRGSNFNSRAAQAHEALVGAVRIETAASEYNHCESFQLCHATRFMYPAH